MRNPLEELPKRIDRQVAEAWLAEHAPHLPVENGRVKLVTICPRCGGTGIYSRQHGVCYRCHGHDSRLVNWIPVDEYLKAERRNWRAREATNRRRMAKHEQRLDKQRDWNEAHGNGRLTFAELDEKRQAAREAEREARRRPAPEGRMTITGRVLKVEQRDSDYGWNRVENRMTLAIETPDGGEWLAWGTAPRELMVIGADGGFAKGATVTLTATIKRSDRDAHFAFFKRPTGAELVVPAPAE